MKLPDKKDLDEVTLEEIDIVMKIHAKYGTQPRDTTMMAIFLQSVGYGRNKETANILRAVADMIDSPIETKESIDAKAAGKLM